MIEHVALSEDEMEQLGEDEYHRHLQTTVSCNNTFSAILAAFNVTMTPSIYQAITNRLNPACFTM